MKRKTQGDVAAKIAPLYLDASVQGTSTLGLIYRVLGILLLLSVVTLGVNAWA